MAAFSVSGGEAYELRNGDVENDGGDQPSYDGNDLEPAATLRCELIRREPRPVFTGVPAP